MIKIKAWLNAFRLRTLPLSLSGIILGSFIAKNNGFWDNKIFVFSLLTTILFQLVSNLANDLGDTQKGTDNEHRVGPTRMVQAGLISQKEMKVGVVICAVLSLITASFLIYYGTKGLPKEMIYFYGFLAFASVIAAITYTVGKKAYGYHGFGDVFVFIFFGLVSVLGVYTLYSKSFDILNLFPAITIGLLSTAVLNLNNMRDRENDERSGKNTLVVKLGAKSAKKYHFALVILAFISHLIFCILSSNFVLLISLIPFLLLFKHLIFVSKNIEEVKLDPELKKVALSTFLISVLFMLLVIIF